MKNTLRQIADILYNVPLMNRNRMIGIMAPLHNENQANAMLEYLKLNQNNNDVMRIDTLLKTSLRISDTI